MRPDNSSKLIQEYFYASLSQVVINGGLSVDSIIITRPYYENISAISFWEG